MYSLFLLFLGVSLIVGMYLGVDVLGGFVRLIGGVSRVCLGVLGILCLCLLSYLEGNMNQPTYNTQTYSQSI